MTTYPRITKAQALERLGNELAAVGAPRERGAPSALARLLGITLASVSSWEDDAELPELQAWRLHAMRPAWFASSSVTAG